MTGHPLDFLSGDGECAEVARGVDWSNNPLGPPEGWPASLKTIVATLLHSRHPMFLFWGEELVQFYNDAYRPSFGAGKHPAAMGQRGRDCWQEIWAIIGPQIDDVMRLGKPSWNEDALVPIYRNGRIEEVYWTYGYSPVYDEEGHIRGTLVVCTETTARVVAERRLELLRLLAAAQLTARDPADVAVMAMGVLANATRDVPFALFLSGEAAPLSVGVSDEAARAAREALHGALDVAGKHALSVPLLAGGSAESSEAVYVVPFDGKPQTAFVFGLNPQLPFDRAYERCLVTIVENAQSTLARVGVESERRNLLEQAPMPTAIMVGPAHVFELANPLYREMVGRDVRGKAYLEAFPELRDTPLPAILDAVYERGTPFVTNEMLVPLVRRATGELEQCFFKFNLEPLRNAEGRVYGMMAVAADMTEQVSARHSLEAAARAKDEFLALMSHELRTPLNAMLGWAKILVAEHGDEAKLAKGLDVIARNAATQARIVDDLLDVSRIVTGKLSLTLAWADVAAVVLAAVDAVRGAAESKGVELSVDVDHAGRTVADGDRLQQIVWNLVANAVRFTPAGGTVTVSARREENALRIVVKDSGIGISSQNLSTIFERFRQVEPASTRAHGGLGLGLAIVRYLAEAHGGTVTAESGGDGLGACFEVRLPARADRPTPPATKPIESPQPNRLAQTKKDLDGLRVLVVEDDPDSLDLLREVLEGAGAKTTGARDAHGAMAERGPFDIIVSDIGMPGVDGYALIRYLRAQPATKDVPAIALTAYAHATDVLKALDAGFQEHVTKPLDPARVIATLKRWAGTSRP